MRGPLVAAPHRWEANPPIHQDMARETDRFKSLPGGASQVASEVRRRNRTSTMVRVVQPPRL